MRFESLVIFLDEFKVLLVFLVSFLFIQAQVVEKRYMTVGTVAPAATLSNRMMGIGDRHKRTSQSLIRAYTTMHLNSPVILGLA